VREDMSKVLVESMREGRAYAAANDGARRLRRNAVERDGESAPQRMGIRRDAIHRKHFGEHLGPLFRYLRGQAHRPWAKVHGELCAQLDRRSVVQAHLFQHIGQMVEVETHLQDGEVWYRGWRGLQPIRESRAELFVHPVTGILLPNRARLIAQRQRNEAREAQRGTPHPDRRRGLPGMAGDVQWQRIDGLWFELTMRPVADAPQWDVVLKRSVDDDYRFRALLKDTYGCASCFAIAKRQLGAAALRKHGLASAAA